VGTSTATEVKQLTPPERAFEAAAQGTVIASF
jgi:hypothetical protein